MTGSNNFENAKKEALAQNERLYGAELREKYGADAVEKSNQKYMSMTEKQREQVEELARLIMQGIKAGVESGGANGDAALETAALHKKWLMYYWADYSPEAHAGLCDMYLEDERFKSYYDAAAEGGAEFLRNAVYRYLGM